MAKKHTHKFTARPCDDEGRLTHDRGSDLKGRYTTYRRFVKFKFNPKGQQGQAYMIFEHCESPCGEVLVRKVMVTPR